MLKSYVYCERLKFLKKISTFLCPQVNLSYAVNYFNEHWNEEKAMTYGKLLQGYPAVE